MGEKERVLNRQYKDEFKVEAERLDERIGGSRAARRLGILDSSLWNWNWIRLSRAGKLRAVDPTAVPVKRSVSEVEAENTRLRRELASTKGDFWTEALPSVVSGSALRVNERQLRKCCN